MSEHPPQPPEVLAYAQATPGRPGLLTAIAVVSIVLGALSILANLCGAVQSVFIAASSSIPTNAAGGPQWNPWASMPRLLLFLTSGLSVIEMGLAGYLLVAGILLLRNRSSSRKHHLDYAGWKILLATLSAVAGAWFQYQMQRSIFANMPPSPAGQPMTMPPAMLTWMALAYGGVIWIISVAYPITLLVLLNRPKIRASFEALPG